VALRASPGSIFSAPEIPVKADIVKSTLLRIGLTMTRHPRMGAAEEPKVTQEELVENRRLREKPVGKRYPRGERKLL
jgi:hypothetical protein